MIGKFEKVDLDEDSDCWGQSLRVRVSINIHKPLKRGILMKLGAMAEERWVRIAYEKIPDFCYGCGMLGHLIMDCKKRPEEQENEPRFGASMRYSGYQKRYGEGRENTGEPSNLDGRGRGRTSF